MTNTSRVMLLILAIVLLAVPAMAQYSPDPTTPRSEIPEQYKWDASHIYTSMDDWNADYAKVEAVIPELAAFEGRMGESAAVLKEFIQTTEDAVITLYGLYRYAANFADTDMANAEFQQLQGKVGFLFQKFGSAVSFSDPEFLSLPDGTIEGFLAADADLQVYEQYFQNILRMKPHTLSKEEEAILSMTGQVRGVAGDVSGKLRNVDMKFPTIVDEEGETVPLTLAGFSKYRASNSYNVRKQASEAFFKTFRQYENTLAATLDGVVKSHLMTKKLRNYDSCLEAALKPDDISPATYRMLVDTINANLDRTLHKYVTLRKKVMGLDGPVTFANLYNPMLEGVEEEYTYDQCREMLAEGLKPLGKEYVELVKTAADPANGWIDIYPNENKRTGAYSSGIAAYLDGGHPYVLHNFDNTLDAVFTTAHEFGHSLHSYYSIQEQPFAYSDYTTFLAEVASTCNESILLNHLLKKEKDPVKKLMLLNKRMENIRQTIFRQTLFAEFELKFHEYAEEDNTLTAEFLNGLYADLIKRYYGPDFQMGENDEVEWAFIPHFNYNFYVFSYATGLTSGIAMAGEIDKHGDKAANRYIDNMLKAGSSLPPLEILKNAGVDMETPAPILTMLDVFENTIEEFDKLWTKTYQK
jgi:oligoendopeptidase F